MGIFPQQKVLRPCNGSSGVSKERETIESISGPRRRRPATQTRGGTGTPKVAIPPPPRLQFDVKKRKGIRIVARNPIFPSQRSGSKGGIGLKNTSFWITSGSVATRATLVMSLCIERTNRRLILRFLQKSLKWPSSKPSGGKTDALSPFLMLLRLSLGSL